jgi:hypothetical protein
LTAPVTPTVDESTLAALMLEGPSDLAPGDDVEDRSIRRFPTPVVISTDIELKEP